MQLVAYSFSPFDLCPKWKAGTSETSHETITYFHLFGRYVSQQFLATKEFPRHFSVDKVSHSSEMFHQLWNRFQHFPWFNKTPLNDPTIDQRWVNVHHTSGSKFPDSIPRSARSAQAARLCNSPDAVSRWETATAPATSHRLRSEPSQVRFSRRNRWVYSPPCFSSGSVCFFLISFGYSVVVFTYIVVHQRTYRLQVVSGMLFVELSSFTKHMILAGSVTIFSSK